MSLRLWTDVTALVRPYLYDDAVQVPCLCGETTLGVAPTDQAVTCWACGREWRAKIVVEVRSPRLPEGDEG